MKTDVGTPTPRRVFSLVRIQKFLRKVIDWSLLERVALVIAVLMGLATTMMIAMDRLRVAAMLATQLAVGSIAFAVFLARRIRVASSLQIVTLERLLRAPTSLSVTKVHSRGGILAAKIGCHADYLKIAANRDLTMSLDATMIRTGSLHGRDLFSFFATDKCFDYQLLRSACEGYREPSRKGMMSGVVRSLRPDRALRFARVLALQNELADDQKNAFSIMNMMYETSPAEIFVHPFGKIFFELAFTEGNIDLARQIVRKLPIKHGDRIFMEADLANPFVGHGTDYEHWLERFNRPFVRLGLEPVLLTDASAGESPMDRILCPVEPEQTTVMPSVSVIITTWCAGLGLLTAVRSILQQTWRNLEVIVVDDASPPELAPMLSECQALDARVRVIRQPINCGTYVARNAALEYATGDFVTFQDDDDWSHPRRIERQLSPMLADASVMMTVSRALRCNESMVFTYVGYSAQRKNASSLMFRREPVLARIGFMDSVRKGADSEYAQRIIAAFGQAANVDIIEPLAIIRMRNDSLSRSDFKPGWHHPARVSYRDSYQYWHAEISSGRADPYRHNEIEPRPFPAPTRFLVDTTGERSRSRSRYDFVIAGDWRKFGGPQKSMIEEIKSLRMSGFKVAVLHLEAFRFMDAAERKLCTPLLELMHTGEVDEIAISDRVHCDVLVLRYPPILQFLPALPSALKIGLFLVVANQAPCELDGSDLRYEVGPCMQNARDLFGIEPIWVPQGAPVRKALSTLLPSRSLHTEDMPGTVDSQIATEARLPLNSVPVVGRYSRDTVLKFPATRNELLDAYPVSDDIKVRIMGGRMTCQKILGLDQAIPHNWTMLDYGDVEVDEFLRKIDFFVYFDHYNIIEAFGRSLLEAMATGCVVIAHPKFEEIFGGAAIYCDARDVADTIRRLHADPDAYSAQSKKALDEVHQKFSRAAYIARMRAFRDLVVSKNQVDR